MFKVSLEKLQFLNTALSLIRKIYASDEEFTTNLDWQISAMLGMIEWKDALDKVKETLSKLNRESLCTSDSRACCFFFGDQIMKDASIKLKGYYMISAVQNYTYALIKSLEELPSEKNDEFDKVFKVLLSIHAASFLSHEKLLLNLIDLAPENEALWLPLLQKKHGMIVTVIPKTVNDLKVVHSRIFNTGAGSDIHNFLKDNEGRYVSFVEYDGVPLSLFAFDTMGYMNSTDELGYLKKASGDLVSSWASYPDHLFRIDSSKSANIADPSHLIKGQKSGTCAAKPILAALKYEIAPPLRREANVRVAHQMLKNFPSTFVGREELLIKDKIRKVAAFLPERILKKVLKENFSNSISQSLLTLLMPDLEMFHKDLQVETLKLVIVLNDPSRFLKDFMTSTDSRTFVGLHKGRKLFELRLVKVGEEKEQLYWTTGQAKDTLQIEHFSKSDKSKKKVAQAPISVKDGDRISLKFKRKGSNGVKIGKINFEFLQES